MTDASPTNTAEIRDDEDLETARLDREADALLAGANPSAFTGDEGRAFEDQARPGVSSVRRAVREDLQHGRDVARDRAQQARDAIRDEPIKTAIYAVGVGVLIGLLLRR